MKTISVSGKNIVVSITAETPKEAINLFAEAFAAVVSSILKTDFSVPDKLEEEVATKPERTAAARILN